MYERKGGNSCSGYLHKAREEIWHGSEELVFSQDPGQLAHSNRKWGRVYNKPRCRWELSWEPCESMRMFSSTGFFFLFF